jgi:putative ABC transport system ATP-binding protein
LVYVGRVNETTPTIRTEGLSRRYAHRAGSVTALDGVTMTLEPGAYVAVVGPSGSGKSTLMHQLGLLDRPSEGTVWFGSTDTAGLSDDERAEMRRTRIGFVFQFFQLLPGLRAWENVAVPQVLAGARMSGREHEAKDLLNAVGLADRGDHRPDELSGGQQQRVAIARAVAGAPAIVLADEPTGALDATTALEVQLVLERLTVDLGRTLVVVTHDPGVAARARQRIELRDGRVHERVGA